MILPAKIADKGRLIRGNRGGMVERFMVGKIEG